MLAIWDEIAQDPDRGANRLVSEYGNRLFASARFLTGNTADAEDLVFRTFAQVVRCIGRYDGSSAFYTWIYSVMLNFRRSDLRRKGAQALLPMEEVPEEADLSPDPAERFVLSSDAVAIRRAVSELPELYRQVVVLFYFEEIEIAEMARLLAVPVGTVKARLHRARKELAQKLMGEIFVGTAEGAKEKKIEERRSV